ncbi:MAG: NUDIX hydrolase [Gammaproteobacteria bacterium]|nr:NUDIX hydrolase [Gammaproteobacteria bacterium]
MSANRIWKPHATVAAVIERDGRFLLVEEAINGEIIYNQPAGHLEEGESLIAATVREVLEETARHFTPEAVVGVYRWRNPHSGVTFLRIALTGTCSEPEPDRTLDEGVLAARWFTREQAARLKLRAPMVLRCMDDYLAGARHPLSLLVDLP